MTDRQLQLGEPIELPNQDDDLWTTVIVSHVTEAKVWYRLLSDATDVRLGPKRIDAEGETWRRAETASTTFNPIGTGITEQFIDPQEVILDSEQSEHKNITASMAHMQVYPIIVLARGKRPRGWPKSEPPVGHPIVAGRKRTVSARVLNWCVMRAYVCADEMAAARARSIITLAENAKGKDHLTDARAIKALKDDELAGEVSGLTVAEMNARTKLLRLAPVYQEMLDRRELSNAAARSLLGTRNHQLSHDDQHQVWALAVKMAEEQEKKRPTALIVKRAMKIVLGEIQPQMPVPRPEVSTGGGGPDPVHVAQMVRECAIRGGYTVAEVAQLNDAIDLLVRDV